jgi:DNA-binding transcriptional regulator YdaS (Cro superfamily)
MKKPNPHVQAFVTIVGGRKEAAVKLGMTVAMVGHLSTGERQVSPKVAIAIEQASNGAIKRSALRPDLWQPESEAA